MFLSECVRRAVNRGGFAEQICQYLFGFLPNAHCSISLLPLCFCVCVHARTHVCVVNQSLLASAISFQLGVSQTELTSISLHKVHHTSINKLCAAHYCCVISELDGANVQ